MPKCDNAAVTCVNVHRPAISASATSSAILALAIRKDFMISLPFIASDERLYFPANLLRAGENRITIHVNGTGLTDFLMVDYLRLELPGYVPPAPARVAAYAGNNAVLVSWPVVPGATGYDVLRSNNPTSGYAPVATGMAGIVCGSDALNMTYADSTARNGTTYYYRIVSKNPQGQSAASPISAAAVPLATVASALPPAPARVQVSSSGHHRVTLAWTPANGAIYYRVSRSALHSNNVGSFYPLRTILLNDEVNGTEFTDTTATDGKRYRYYVQGVSPAGIGLSAQPVDALPLPPVPASAPQSLAGQWIKTRNGVGISLKWSPVPGATGYVIYRSAHGEHFAWPDDFVTPLLETTWTDTNKAKKANEKKGDEHIDAAKDYYYQVTAINAAGVSPAAVTHVAAENHSPH